MPTQHSSHTFTLEMTLEQANAASHLLQSIGVQFEPGDALLQFDPDEDDYWTMRGRDLDDVITQINQHLQEHHPGLTVPDPVTLEQRAEALHLAYWQFEWRRNSVCEDLWTHGGANWRTVIDRYPALFAAGAHR